MTDSDLYNYLVLEMKAKRQFRSKVYFEDKHVNLIQSHPVTEDCSHCLVRCRVIPSIPTSDKKNNPDHSAWVYVSKVSGKVHSADCDCTAGSGEACNHISALLNAIVDITSKKKDGTISSTSSKCKWNNPRERKLSPSRIQELKFHKNSASYNSNSMMTNVDKMESTFKQIINVNRLKTNLEKKSSNVSWLIFFEKEKKELEVSVPTLLSTDYMYSNHMLDKFNNMTTDEEDAFEIEKLTQGQVKNDKWRCAKKQRITSSNFGKICKLKSETKPDSVIKDLLGYRDMFSNKHYRWGIQHEPAARSMYSDAVKSQKMTVKTCALIVNPQYPHLGTSPDGLVHVQKEDQHNDGNGLLEIKCSSSDKWKFNHPRACTKEADFYCQLDENGDVHLKQSHHYYYQVQGQMMVTERKWCDFMVWTLKGWTVERIVYDLNFCESMLQKLNSFYIRNILPEMFSERIKRGRPLYT